MGSLCSDQKQIRPRKLEIQRSLRTDSFQYKQTYQITRKTMINKKDHKIHQDYQIMESLGAGTFGEVKKGKHRKTNIYRAIKIVNKRNGMFRRQDMQKQINYLKQLVVCFNQDHPNILKIIEFYEDNTNLYVITQLLTGKQLFDKILENKKFNQQQAASYLKQLLEAINYCHSNSLVHRYSIINRDLKPENILFQSPHQHANLKIIDFGTAAFLQQQQLLNALVGTAYYIAPQVINKKYNQKCDIWSCGVILYIMLSGSPPFNGNTDKQIMQNIRNGELSFKSKQWSKISEDGKDLIRNMIEYDYNKRFSAVEALQHKWFKRFSMKYAEYEQILKDTLQQIQKFYVNSTYQKLNRFQEGIFTFIINFITTEEQKHKLLKSFKSFDTNKDGTLSYNQLFQGYQKIYGEIKAQLVVPQILKEFDKDKSGTIDYSQFVVASIKKQQIIIEENLNKAFILIDNDGNGFIDVDELKDALGKNIKVQYYHEMISEVDKNSDGKISKQQFYDAMKNIFKNKNQ